MLTSSYFMVGFLLIAVVFFAIWIYILIRSDKNVHWLIITTILFTVCCLACSPFLLIESRMYEIEGYKVIQENGAKAYRLGVPANANPYISHRTTAEARHWLNGWMSEKENSINLKKN